jgi:hypothetical protein
VVAAVIAFAQTALTAPLEIAVAIAAATLWLVGVSEIFLLAGGAHAIAVARLGRGRPFAALLVPLTAGGATAIDLPTLAAVFLKAGALCTARATCSSRSCAATSSSGSRG